MTIDGIGEKRPILGIKGSVPSTKLIEATRVPTREEVSYLSQVLSDKNRTVEIKFIPTRFNARLFGAEHNDFRCLPSGYMVNIQEKSERHSGFYRVLAEKAQGSLLELFSKIGIDNPHIDVVLHTQNKNLTPNKGVFVDIYTMGKLCAAAVEVHRAEAQRAKQPLPLVPTLHQSNQWCQPRRRGQ